MSRKPELGSAGLLQSPLDSPSADVSQDGEGAIVKPNPWRLLDKESPMRPKAEDHRDNGNIDKAVK
jgi:hypothetical protein